MLYNSPNIFYKIKIRVLSRMGEILDIINLFIFLHKIFFLYVIKKILIFLKKPWFLINFLYKFDDFNIYKKEIFYIIFLGYYISFNFDLLFVKFPNLLFFNPLNILLIRFWFWASVRFLRIKKLFYIIFFIIIKFQFRCFAPLKNLSSNVKTNPLQKRQFFNIFKIITVSVFSSNFFLSLRNKIHIHFIRIYNMIEKIKNSIPNILLVVLITHIAILEGYNFFYKSVLY